METDSSGLPKKTFVVVKDYKLKELAAIYKISEYRMRIRIKRIIKQIGKMDGYYYQTEQVEKIFKLIVLPSDTFILRA